MTMPAPVVIVAVSRRGAALAGRMRAGLTADLIMPERLAELTSVTGAGPVHFYGAGGIRGAVADAFLRYRGIVLVLPVGAAVRLIASHIANKHADPGVVALDEAGAYAVALLSGHVGGGNALAHAVATTVGAHPVVTTAAEALGSQALDLLGRDWGWSIEDDAGLTRASAALLDGEPIGAFQDAGEEVWWRDVSPNLQRYASLADLAAARAAARLVISDRVLAVPLEPPLVVYRPKSLIVGVGCVRGATAEEIEAPLTATLAEHGLVLDSVRALATIDRKRDEVGICTLAARHGWALQTYSAAELAMAGTPSGASAAVQDAVGAPGVCEPAALLASGAPTLLVPKMRTRRVTIAVARIHFASSPLTHQAFRGGLALVGIGPGGPEGLTARARELLQAADAVVGYHGYLDLLRPWLVGPVLHGSPIGEEVPRARLAIMLARAGQSVALVSSGDAGVYGTAGIVFELLGDEGADAEAAAVEVVPGVSAAHAAAALLGAPLMNDYATISLSDLMTPWEVIERRLRAVAEADMVVALYNPMSGRRRAQLARAQAILLAHRPPTTPVGLVRNAGRPGQTVRVVNLGDLLDQEIDMLTIVIVGNRATIRVGDRLVTRRGYLGDPSARDRSAQELSHAE
jgi:cobalt-precorrin 5A hydrolase / precorrin-3B C17-methyltransferase